MCKVGANLRGPSAAVKLWLLSSPSCPDLLTPADLRQFLSPNILYEHPGVTWTSNRPTPNARALYTHTDSNSHTQPATNPTMMSEIPVSAQMSPACTSSTGTLLKLSYTNSSLTLPTRHLPAGSRLLQMDTCWPLRIVPGGRGRGQGGVRSKQAGAGWRAGWQPASCKLQAAVAAARHERRVSISSSSCQLAAVTAAPHPR